MIVCCVRDNYSQACKGEKGVQTRAGPGGGEQDGGSFMAAGYTVKSLSEEKQRQAV